MINATDFLLLFDSGDFPARWHCGTWTAFHGWTHVVADLAVAGAYIAIPTMLAYFVWKRGEAVPHSRLVWLFVMFILSCGLTHLVDAQTFWNPIYRFSALMKVLTAIASWATVVALLRVFPTALELPGVVDHNARLQAEIAERAKVEAQLRKSQRELRLANTDLTQFAGVVSHDLRAPLRAIRSLAAWTRADSGDELPEVAARHLDRLDDRVRRLESMIDGLLSYATSDSVEQRETVRSLASLEKDIEQRIALAEATHIAWHWPGEARVLASEPFAHALQNLVGNAIQHCGKHGVRVEVSATARDGRLHVSVDDNGPGIPADARKRVLEIFRTLAPRDGTEVQGLGLALVKRAVERQGGQLRIDDSSLGGARFSFDWPLESERSL